MLNEEQLKTLYNKSREEYKSYGYARSCTYGHWLNGTRPQWLYKLALDVAKVKSMPDADVLPTVFGAGWFEDVRKVCRSEYYFWRIAHEWSLQQKEDDPLMSATRAISEVRADNTKMWIDRRLALAGNLSPNQICEFTHHGIILWDYDQEKIVLNPLWFADKELQEVAIGE
jgi:hypothetical protein